MLDTKNGNRSINSRPSRPLGGTSRRVQEGDLEYAELASPCVREIEHWKRALLSSKETYYQDDKIPGTHTYSPEKIKVLTQTPRPAIGKSPRWDESMVFRKNFENL